MNLCALQKITIDEMLSTLVRFSCVLNVCVRCVRKEKNINLTNQDNSFMFHPSLILYGIVCVRFFARLLTVYVCAWML